MTKILELLGVIGGFIPVILALIKQFETPGFGAEKKKAVLDALGKIYDGLGLTMDKAKLMGIAGAVIDVAVAFFNIIGWTKSGNPTPSI